MSEQEPEKVDPVDFLKSILHIDPDDAAKVREDSPATRKRTDLPGSPPREDPDR